MQDQSVQVCPNCGEPMVHRDKELFYCRKCNIGTPPPVTLNPNKYDDSICQRFRRR